MHISCYSFQAATCLILNFNDNWLSHKKCNWNYIFYIKSNVYHLYWPLPMIMKAAELFLYTIFFWTKTLSIVNLYLDWLMYSKLIYFWISFIPCIFNSHYIWKYNRNVYISSVSSFICVRYFTFTARSFQFIKSSLTSLYLF